MDQWQEIENELIRMRQAWSCPRDIRKLGEANFELRPILANAVQRYTRGRCMDFAVRLAMECHDHRLAGFYSGENLVHAFVLREMTSGQPPLCIEVSGIWTLAEMKKLHASDGKFALRHLDLAQTLAEMEMDEQKGADFDSKDIVLSVSDCLPHLRGFIPSEYAVDNAEDALSRLKMITASRFTESFVEPAVHRTHQIDKPTLG